MKTFYKVAGLGLILAAVGFAQEDRKFTFDLGYGFTTPAGNTGRHLDNGWNLRGAVGYNFSRWVGFKVDLGYDSFAIDSASVSEAGASGGSFNVFSATLDPVLHLNPSGHVDFYVTGGGGVFHRHQDFTQPGNGVNSAFDPFFGFPAAGANQISPYSVNKPGIDVGAGFAVGAGHGGAKAFFEAKYERMFIGSYHTDYLPVTVGLRW